MTDEVMTPVPTTEALQMAAIQAMRQIGENVAAQTRRLETLTGKVDDIRERVIRLEEQKTSKLVEELRSDLSRALARIDQLESLRDKTAGAASVWTWLTKNAPWLFAGVAAFAAGMGFKGGQP